MTVEKDRGFVLDHVRLSDHRFVVNLFTAAGGRRKGVFRMSKQQPQALLTPLSLWSFQFSGREQAELKNIAQVSLEAHCYELGSRYLGLTLLQHMARLLTWSQPEAHADDRVFRLVTHVVDHLRHRVEPARFAAANLYFEVWLLHFGGMLPRSIFRGEADEPPAVSDEARFWRQLPAELLRGIFQSTVEDFTADALQLGSLSEAHQTLGKFWEHFLGRNLKMRHLLTQQFQERRLW